MSAGKNLMSGIYTENPVFRLMLGLVPAVGATTTALHGLYLGLMTAVIMTVATVIVGLLRPLVPKVVHGILHVALLTVLVAALQQWLVGIRPALVVDLGIYIPLIVVNSMILWTLSSDESVAEMAAAAVGRGIGFTVALLFIGIIREFLAFGQIFGATVLDTMYSPFALANTVPGGLLIVGLLMALVNWIMGKGGEIHE